MNFIAAEVQVLEDRKLSDEVTLSKEEKVTVTTIKGGGEIYLKLWHHTGQYKDYQKYYNVNNPMRIIRYKIKTTK